MELRILELITAFFLFLSIIRPLVRGLWKLPGLAVFPLLALGILIGSFAAYGFRPECIPLVIFTLFFLFANFQDLAALFSGLQSDSYRDKGLLFTLGSAAAFAFVLWITLCYGPPLDMEPGSQGVETITLQDYGRNTRLYVRIYGPLDPADNGTPEQSPERSAAEPERSPEQPAPVERPLQAQEAPEQGISPEPGEIPGEFAGAGRPLAIVIPPAAGSLAVTADLCEALRHRGWTVLTYTRPGFDSPAFDGDGMPVRLSIPGLYRLANALCRGQSDVSANAGGRALEEGRRQDTEFLLGELDGALRDRLPGTDTASVFLAGYGAGGAALTALAGDSGFVERYSRVRGIIAVEAPLLSSLEGDPLPPPPPMPGNPLSAFTRRIEDYREGLKPRKITRIGDIPRPRLPILFIVSGRVIKERSGHYETVLRTLGASENAAFLAAVPGAGPFDYSGSPNYYPILSVLFRGARDPQLSGEPGRQEPGEILETGASLITNFAAAILESKSDFPVPLERTALEGVYLESGGVWHNTDSLTILEPWPLQ